MGIRRRVLILLFIIILLFCTSCSVQFASRKKLGMMLDSLTTETDEIVYYMFHNKLYASELKYLFNQFTFDVALSVLYVVPKTE